MSKYTYIAYKDDQKINIDYNQLEEYINLNFEIRVEKEYLYYITIYDLNDLEEWYDKLARDNAWKPEDSVYSTPKVKWNPFDEKETQIELKSCNDCDVIFPCHNKIEECIREPKKYLGKTPVNPKHYQSYMQKTSDGVIKDYEFETLQWLESIQYKTHYQNQEYFRAAILLQADKYLSRLGGKDDDVQEIMKAIWYLKFLAAYIKNQGPIRVVDIKEILGDEV